MKRLCPIVFSLVLLSNLSFGQKVVSTAGDHQNGSNVQISWTLGEPLIETLNNTQNILTQGFHQPKLVLTALDGLLFDGLKIEVFPNPATYQLNLKISEGESKNLSYSLFDLNGKIIRQKNVENNIEKIDLFDFSAGSYILKLSLQNGQTVQTFKVVKN